MPEQYERTQTQTRDEQREEQRLERTAEWGETGERFGRNYPHLIGGGTAILAVALVGVASDLLVYLVTSKDAPKAPSAFTLFANKQDSFWGVRSAFSFLALTVGAALKPLAPNVSRSFFESAANIINMGEKALEKLSDYVHPHRP